MKAKSLGGLFLSLALVWSATAMACPHTQQRFICPGDRVVDPSGYVGHVRAVNPFHGTVAINYGGTSDSQYNISSVALGLGCLEGYCTGDLVVDASGYRGNIDGVNPYNRTVAINYGGTSDSIYNIQQVSLGLGCRMGYCVGDKVVDPSGYEGTIEAVNRYSGQAAINYGGTSDSLYAIEQLSSSEYCSTYGDADRAVPLYPVFQSSLYDSPNFHFSMRRPVR